MSVYQGDSINFGDAHIGYIGVVANVVNIREQRERHAASVRSATSDFVGREAELEQIQRQLTSGGSAAICGVTAMGGMGKTQLALKAAELLQGRFDYQLLVQISGQADDDMALLNLLAAAIRSISPEVELPDDLPTRQQIYTALLSHKSMLIIIDNAWSARQIEALRPPPGCVLLVTSRNRLAVRGMALLELDVLSLNEATTLLLGICPRIGESAAELAELCGHLPLALTISASFLLVQHNRPIERYLDQLRQERLRYLALPDSDPNDPQASVEASLRISYDALSYDERNALCTLAIAVAPFNHATALALIGNSSKKVAGKFLDTLLRRTLIIYDTATQRYRLHDLVREFAKQHLPKAQPVWLRYAHHCLDIILTAEQEHYVKGKVLEGLTLFDAERAHIDAAWAWLRSKPPEPETDLLLCNYAIKTTNIGGLRYDMRRERIPHVEAWRDAGQRLGPQWQHGAVLAQLGNAYYQLGELQTAITYYEQNLTIARTLGDKQGESMTLGYLGLAYAALDEPHTAIRYYKQQLAIAREQKFHTDQASALSNLGNAYFMLEDVEAAIMHFKEGLALQRAIGDQRSERATLGSLGRAHQALGQFDQANSSYEAALDLAEKLGDQRGKGQSSWNLGLLRQQQGRLPEAVQLMQVFVDYLTAVGHTDTDEHAGYLASVRKDMNATGFGKLIRIVWRWLWAPSWYPRGGGTGNKGGT